MRYKKLWALISILSIAVITGTVFSVLHVQASQPVEPVQSPEALNALIQKELTIFGRPLRIRIPTIGVDTNIVQVGLKPDGTIAAPKGPVEAGWYYAGTLPGHTGSAVIDGHYGWKDNIRAVFDKLSLLKVGSLIYVEDQKGMVAAFIVREVRTYGQNDDTSAVFGSDDGKSHLNLITCGGIWNKASQHYADRTVVFADAM